MEQKSYADQQPTGEVKNNPAKVEGFKVSFFTDVFNQSAAIGNQIQEGTTGFLFFKGLNNGTKDALLAESSKGKGLFYPALWEAVGEAQFVNVINQLGNRLYDKKNKLSLSTEVYSSTNDYQRLYQDAYVTTYFLEDDKLAQSVREDLAKGYKKLVHKDRGSAKNPDLHSVVKGGWKDITSQYLDREAQAPTLLSRIEELKAITPAPWQKDSFSALESRLTNPKVFVQKQVEKELEGFYKQAETLRSTYIEGSSRLEKEQNEAFSDLTYKVKAFDNFSQPGSELLPDREIKATLEKVSKRLKSNKKELFAALNHSESSKEKFVQEAVKLSLPEASTKVTTQHLQSLEKSTVAAREI